MPPEAYFPFVDAWLARAPDALVFVATDQVSYLHRFEARYGRAAVVGGAGGAGRVLSSQAARRTDQFIHASSGAGRDGGGGGEGDGGGGAQGVGSGGFARGRAALHDALLLSECDFLLKSASAIPEFALWVRPALHERHVDLQLEDRFRSQQLPAWAAHLAADGGAAFCAALARGCALDAAADAAAAAAAANRTRLASASASASSSSSAWRDGESDVVVDALGTAAPCSRAVPVRSRNASSSETLVPCSEAQAATMACAFNQRSWGMPSRTSKAPARAAVSHSFCRWAFNPRLTFFFQVAIALSTWANKAPVGPSKLGATSADHDCICPRHRCACAMACSSVASCSFIQPSSTHWDHRSAFSHPSGNSHPRASAAWGSQTTWSRNRKDGNVSPYFSNPGRV